MNSIEYIDLIDVVVVRCVCFLCYFLFVKIPKQFCIDLKPKKKYIY